jgi:hypothetical protein
MLGLDRRNRKRPLRSFAHYTGVRRNCAFRVVIAHHEAETIFSSSYQSHSIFDHCLGLLPIHADHSFVAVCLHAITPNIRSGIAKAGLERSREMGESEIREGWLSQRGTETALPRCGTLSCMLLYIPACAKHAR